MMTRQTYSKALATALLLGAAAGGAHAQFNTSGTYVLTGADATARPVIAAPGNTQTLTTFQTNIAAAFAAGTGGDITFDNATVAGAALATSVTATYGVLQGSTLTLTQNLPLTAATGAGNYSTGVDAPNVTSAGTNANYFGYSNVSVSATTYNFDFNFSQNLSDFGIMVINRGASRPVTFTINLSDGSTVTGASSVATSQPASSPTFFEYSATGPLTITGVNFSAPGYTRFDDLGFITAAPEPSQCAALSIGILGVGLLALRARRRQRLV